MQRTARTGNVCGTYSFFIPCILLQPKKCGDQSQVTPAICYLMEKHCVRLQAGLSDGLFKLFIEGTRLLDCRTFGDQAIEHGDKIDLIMEQLGD